MERFSALGLLILSLGAGQIGPARGEETVEQLQAAFARHSGTKLVFRAEELPDGRYHDVMPSLSDHGRLRAARIAYSEIKKYPPGFLGQVGLKAVGIFQACVSKEGDGFRPYDKDLKGYRYFGIWNGKDGVAGAYYTDEQLPLTLHHEIFHHVDAASHAGAEANATFTRDERLRDALSGKQPYAALKIAAEDLAPLKKASRGSVLEDAVSAYAKKSPGEDKAETARHFMTNLADSLIQAATRPQLPGSQRILHILSLYETALPKKGPGSQWFVDLALGRVREEPEPPRKDAAELAEPAGLLKRLQILASHLDPEKDNPDEVRKTLQKAAELDRKQLAGDQGKEMVKAAAEVTYRLMHNPLAPTDQERRFTVRGQEDENGINWTLRKEVTAFGQDALRLQKLAALAPEEAALATRVQLRNLRLLSRYYVFISSRWNVTGATRQIFEKSRDDFAASLPRKEDALARALKSADFESLAEAITSEGKVALTPDGKIPAARPGAILLDNLYLKKVDDEIADLKVRATIRKVQPACVWLGGNSGVCISADGTILTVAHVADRVGAKMTAQFPDGRRFTATCIAFDERLDLAVCSLDTRAKLPFAPLASSAPDKDTSVVCIGQPGTSSPRGEATGHKPFHVSTGFIRGFVGDPLGEQSQGRTKHDAWTYWGHSGSPLFNHRGQIVALHNSWDPKTAMRHAVTWEAIVHFLKKEKIGYRVAR